MQNGEQDVAALAAEELAALGTAGADGGDAPLDDDVDDDDAPAATVHQNSDTGAVELDIDISVLDRPRPPAIVTKLLGNNWRVRGSHRRLLAAHVLAQFVGMQCDRLPFICHSYACAVRAGRKCALLALLMLVKYRIIALPSPVGDSGQPT